MDQYVDTPPANCEVLVTHLSEALCFGPWRFTPETGELENCDRTYRLEPVVANVLTMLLNNAGRLVSRERILDCVWKDRVVVDESLSRAISRIRSVLGDTKKPHRYIETLPKRGYRLVWPTGTTCPG